MGPGMHMMIEMGTKIAAESITREALIRELKNCTDTTVDPLTGSIYMHSSLTIFSQELTVFLGYNNQALMADLADWFDCRDKWTYRTKNMGTDEIIGVWVNLIGATTPELLQTTLPRDAIGGGLASRIIFVYEFKKSKTVIAPFLSQEEIELSKLLMFDLERISMMSGEFHISEEFLDLWAQWYPTQEAMRGNIFDDYRFSGYCERRPTHLLKLSMIMSAARNSEMVLGATEFNEALSTLLETEKNMIYTFSGVGRSDTSDITHRVMQYVARKGETTMSDLMRLYYQDVDKPTLENIIATLMTMEYVTATVTQNETIIKYADKGGMYR